MTIDYCRYLPHGKPIPNGWRLASTLENTIHGHHAILIMANHPRRSIIKNWPKYLKEYRARNHLTQSALADALQVSRRLVENWESGINKPPAYLKKALEQLETWKE